MLPDNQSRLNDAAALAAAEAARAEAAWIRGAFRNRAFSTGSTLPANVNTGSFIVFGAALLVARASGIFMAEVSCAFTGGTAAATFDVQVQTQTAPNTQAGGITITGGTRIGPGNNVIGTVAQTGVYVGSAGVGMTFTNGTGALTQFDTGTQILPTGGTTMTTEWSSVIHNSITANAAETPFTIGNQVLLTVAINSSAAHVWRGFAITLIELP